MSRFAEYDGPQADIFGGLFPEIPVVEPFESFAVTSLVAGHLMHGVVDGVQVLLFGQRGDAFLEIGRASCRERVF